MHYCTNKPNRLYRLALLLGFCGMVGLAQAENIVVAKAETRITDEGYQLLADFDITLSPAAKEALDHGVTLHFISELTLTQSRWYWMDREIARSEQVTKLSYNSLTQQYRLGRGALLQSFLNLPSALRVLGHQIATPVPAEALNNGSGYLVRWTKWFRSNKRFVASASMRLDISQLPKPLQVNALTGNDWDIHSEQYHWLIQPDNENDIRGGTP